jgi:hypothetical protein
VAIAASIIACGLTRAARPTVIRSIPKKAVVSATPSRPPISPGRPPTTALTATMTTATAPVSRADRRMIRA